MAGMPPRVISVSRDELHRFSKVPQESITLVAGFGVLGDAHAATFGAAPLESP